MDNRARLIPPHSVKTTSVRATVTITRSMMDKGQRNARRERARERTKKRVSRVNATREREREKRRERERKGWTGEKSETRE